MLTRFMAQRVFGKASLKASVTTCGVQACTAEAQQLTKALMCNTEVFDCHHDQFKLAVETSSQCIAQMPPL